MIIIRFGWLLAALAFFSCHPSAHSQNNLVLVSDQKPNATIVVSAKAAKYILEAANDLQFHVKLSSGIILPVIKDNEAANIPSGQVIIAVGPSDITEGKVSTSDLKFEEFRIKTDPVSKTIYLVANDGPNNPATHWAVCELLERTVGAKWLWPGELGTFVNKKTTISTPAINLQWVSPYDFRMFKKNTSKDVGRWMTHHRIASTREFQETSNTKGWHEKYYNKYPEIFARTPDGKPYTSTWAIKLPKFRLDNQKYFDLMLEDYHSKGKPAIYTLYPTDGISFDAKMVPGADPLTVYRGQVSLTAPYLDFYKKFDKEVNKDKVVTRFDILAYSAYYFFPENYVFDGRNFNVWFVDRNNDTGNWKRWAATGAKMYLRPNWWNRASFGPDITYKKNGEMLNFSAKSGLAGVKIDGFKDNWALQGLNYYVMARQLYSPKSLEELAAEYAEAFGNGAAEVKEYFQLCSTNSDGFNKELLDTNTEEIDLPENVNLTSVQAIPVLFPEKLRKNLALVLNKAAQKTSGIEKQRVEWLMSGVDVTNLVCEYIIGMNKNPEQPPNNEDLMKQIKEIEAKYPYAITSRSFESVMRKKFKPQNKSPKKK